MLQGISILIFIVAFLYSVILHEIAHGWVANHFGDDTARISGRLSLNPLVHIDPIGSILVPLLLYISQSGFMFGWAKPVPVNPYRLRGGAAAFRWVSLAGVMTNFVIAVFSVLVLKITTQYLGITVNNLGVILFTALFQINLVLAIFNALPLPGFDGFNFLTTFRPVTELIAKSPLGNPLFMAQYGLFLSILILFLFMPLIESILYFIFNLFARFFGI
ncbi:MAG: site-2 protease family protein [Patescibacteria group bacterium]